MSWNKLEAHAQGKGAATAQSRSQLIWGTKNMEASKRRGLLTDQDLDKIPALKRVNFTWEGGQILCKDYYTCHLPCREEKNNRG